MSNVEYAIDVWDLRGTDGRLDPAHLLQHLREFGEEGWELVWMALNVDLVRDGPSHPLVFKRV